MLDRLVTLLILLAAPPLLLGVINRTKAFFAGRSGRPLLQSYYDIAKLLRKTMPTSRTTGAIFLAGPAVGLATSLGAAFLIPLGGHAAPVSFPGDLLLVAYLFGLGRFFTIAAALDTGSAFEGMGAAREATFSCLAEPALFLGFLVLVRLTGSWSLSEMGRGMTPEIAGASSAALILVAAAWFLVMLSENSRIPFDDPNTHLELTMIHEAMVLDHSGPALGMILYGGAVKLLAMAGLLLNAFPFLWRQGPWMNWLVFIAAATLVGVGIGAVESCMARLKLANIPKVLVSACLLSAFGLILSLG